MPIKEPVETPLMKQYMHFKKMHPDAILLFRVGDFYETFSQDAVVASQILGITLTRRANGAAQWVELAGFPHHALDNYLPKLVRAGKRVAICDQLEDPKKTKKLVKRGITELVTPGVVMSDTVLQHKENNFLAALYEGKERRGYGVAFLDISTGEFLVGEGDQDLISKLLAGYSPKEILLERKSRLKLEQSFQLRGFVFDMDDWIFDSHNNYEKLLQFFSVLSLKGFSLEGKSLAVAAAGAILNYLELTEHRHLKHIREIKQIDSLSYVRLDPFTIRSLELLSPMNEGGESLRQVIDQTLTAMGGRLMQKWLLFPLKDLRLIEDRQEIVDSFLNNTSLRNTLLEYFSEIADLERLAAKASVGRISPRDMLSLGLTLSVIAPVKTLCLEVNTHSLSLLVGGLDTLDKLRERIKKELNVDAPVSLGRGQVIAQGVSRELDELRQIAYHGKDYLLEMQQKESERTGIPSLKIGFNSVFGYYIEVRNTHKERVPQEWIRKQTLVNAERYITEDLKLYEERILSAESKIAILEAELFQDLLKHLMSYVEPLQKNSHLLAQLDCLLSFSIVAERYGYTRPRMNNGLSLSIKGGRHPVIERQLPIDSPYVPNDLFLSNKKDQIAIITGPNMSGKSALLRQTALISILAQMGSYVPCQEADLGILDAIFTRVGASDNISQGESTFMVEMQEAASILHHLSPRSLVLFDELGRGTSTYDGISIAWAIIEYIHNHPTSGYPKTLFATHYHELGDLENALERVVNFNVSAKEIDGKMLFLRKLERGCAEHSFGIEVAKLGGMPSEIVKRASEILHRLEEENRFDIHLESKSQKTKDIKDPRSAQGKDSKVSNACQLSFFSLEDPVLADIRELILKTDIDRLTPLEALTKLNDIQKRLKQPEL